MFVGNFKEILVVVLLAIAAQLVSLNPIGLFGANISYAQSISTEDTSAAPNSDLYILCKIEKMVRTLQIIRTTSVNQSTPSSANATDAEKSIATMAKTTSYKGVYTKNGIDSQICQAKNKPVCINVIQNIRKTLEKQGWKCRDISSSQVSDSGSFQN